MGGGVGAYALIENAETNEVVVGRGGVTSQRANTAQGARLGVDIGKSMTGTHAVFQCAVDTRNGKCRKEVQINIVALPSIAEGADNELRGDIIIEGETGTMSNVVIVGVQT